MSGIFLFRPVLVTLRNGQLGAIFLFSLALAVYLLEKKRDFWAGAILPVIALRPNLGIPILAFTGLWLLARRKWAALIGAASTVFTFMLISWAVQPDWLNGWLMMGDDKLLKTFGYHATVWGLTSRFCHHEIGCTVLYGAAAGLILTGLVLYLLLVSSQFHSPAVALSLAIAAGLSLSPYLWAYDQILLVAPVMVLCGILFRRKAAYILTASTPLLISAVALVCLRFSVLEGEDTWSGLLTLFVLTLIISGAVLPVSKVGMTGIRTEVSIEQLER
jgi:hypothetical protein